MKDMIDVLETIGSIALLVGVICWVFVIFLTWWLYG